MNENPQLTRVNRKSPRLIRGLSFFISGQIQYWIEAGNDRVTNREKENELDLNVIIHGSKANRRLIVDQNPRKGNPKRELFVVFEPGEQNQGLRETNMDLEIPAMKRGFGLGIEEEQP